MLAHPREEDHLGRGVALVEFKVQVDADLDDRDELEEVQREDVRLGPVGLPVLRGGGVAEGGDAAARFVRRDGPRGEGGDLAQVGRDGGGGFICVDS